MRARYADMQDVPQESSVWCDNKLLIFFKFLINQKYTVFRDVMLQNHHKEPEWTQSRPILDVSAIYSFGASPTLTVHRLGCMNRIKRFRER